MPSSVEGDCGNTYKNIGVQITLSSNICLFLKPFLNATMRCLLPLAIVIVLLVSCQSKSSADIISFADIDTTIRPQDDFFDYANSKWIARNPIPENRSRYGVSDKITDLVDQQIIDIIKDITSHKQKPGSTNEKMARFFKSGMDTVSINAAGLKPVQYMLDTIDSMQNLSDLQNRIALLQKHYFKSPFSIQYGPYLSNSGTFAFVIGIDGLAMEDRDLYLDDDEYCEEIREKYKTYIENMFRLMGQDSITARQSAQKTYDIEYQIAEISLDKMLTQNQSYVIHNNSIDDLTAQMPVFDWEKYFEQLGVPVPDTMVIRADDLYLSRLDTIMRQVPIDSWKAYLKFLFVDGIAIALDSNFVNEEFDFKMRTLSGQEKNSPRWKLVLDELKRDFDDAVGRLYVDKYFPPEAKKRALEMANNIKSALAERISNADWMCDSTKTKALKKLENCRLKIGYPNNHWVDYTNFIMGDSYVNNIIACMAEYFKYEMSFINKNIRPDLWYEILPSTANMYYVYNQNEIVVPAAMLQLPLFHANGDDAVNYGAIGASIAHELTHGFDSQGQMFDEFGNLNDWWTDSDKEEFNRRAQKLIDRFNSFIVIDSMHADGELTFNENLADLGGLLVAYTAFSKTEQWKDQTKLIDGLTPDQRFFIAYAQSWAGSYRDESIRQRTKTNGHSMPRYRVEGPLPNIDAFVKAFNIKPGDKYYLPDSMRTYIW